MNETSESKESEESVDIFLNEFDKKDIHLSILLEELFKQLLKN
jgi:hypothetical protein